MPGAVFLEGDRVALRPVEQGSPDVELLKFVRTESSYRAALGFDSPWPRSQVESFVESITDDESSHNFFVCRPGSQHRLESERITANGCDRVVDDATDIIGAVNLFDIDQISGTLSYWLFEDFRSNGYVTEAISLVLDHAFGDLGLRRVEANVFEHNERSRAVLDRLGFVHEGTSRDSRYHRGKYQDEHNFGLLEPEWDGRGYHR